MESESRVIDKDSEAAVVDVDSKLDAQGSDNDAPSQSASYPPEVAQTAKTLEQRILSMLQKAVNAEIEEIRRTYDHKIHQMEQEMGKMKSALAQAQAQLKDISSRVPFKPAEVNHTALSDFIKNDQMASRLLYSASAAVTNEGRMPDSKKRKLNDDNSAEMDNEAPESKRHPSRATRSQTDASNSRPQRRVRRSWNPKDFGSDEEEDEDEEFSGKEPRTPASNQPNPNVTSTPSPDLSGPVATYDDPKSFDRPTIQILYRRPPSEPGKRFFFTAEQLAIMNEWLIGHLDNPYPTDADRDYLVSSLDLPWGKINTWITNARRRVVAKLIEQRERGELNGVLSRPYKRPTSNADLMAQDYTNRRAFTTKPSTASSERYSSYGGVSASGEEEDDGSDDAHSAPTAGDEMQVDAASNAAYMDLDL